MAELLVIGLGYSASAFVARHGADYRRIVATKRAPDGSAPDGVETVAFDAEAPTAEALAAVTAALQSATHLLVSAQPLAAGDPALLHFRAAIATAPRLRSIVYYSTVGVYGDHGGAVVDETAELRPDSARARRRVAAEQAWLALGRESGKAAHVLRLAGIYGPGRNQLVKLRDGAAQRIIRDGHVFNRIHVEDVAQATAAAFRRAATEQRVWNVADDAPCGPWLPVAYAAALLGVAPPPEIPFAQAVMSPMARSFWSQNKRVSNRRLREELGVALLYPTYREGLAALAAAGEGR